LAEVAIVLRAVAVPFPRFALAPIGGTLRTVFAIFSCARDWTCFVGLPPGNDDDLRPVVRFVRDGVVVEESLPLVQPIHITDLGIAKDIVSLGRLPVDERTL